MSLFVEPQLARPTSALPTGMDWLFQEKFDGHRAQLIVQRGEVRIFSRNGVDRTHLFGALPTEIARRVPSRCIIDGEVCALDARGRSNLDALSKSIANKGPFQFKAFDLLELENESLIEWPTAARLSQLASGITTDATLSFARTVSDGERLLLEVQGRRGEGIVAKRSDQPYRPGERHRDWLKFKFVERQEFIATGWHEDTCGRMQSLVLATVGSSGLTYRGCVGTGFSEMQRRQLRAELSAGAAVHAPFAQQGGIRNDVRWTDRPIVVEVEYLTLTPSGSAREPRFLGVRHDKDAADVVLELI